MKDVIVDSERLIKGELIIGNQDTIMIFGSEIQNQLRNISKMLSHILIKEDFEQEKRIQIVLNEIQKLDNLKQEKGMIEKLFLKKKHHERMIKEYDYTLRTIDTMQLEVQLQQANIEKNRQLVSEIKKQVEICSKEFETCIKQGHSVLESVSKDEINLNHHDRWSLQDDDLKSWVLRLENRISDIEISYTVSMQTNLQLDNMRRNNEVLLDKIEHTIKKVIPLWKRQICILLGIEQVSKKQIEKRQSLDNLYNQSVTLEELVELDDKSKNYNWNEINQKILHTLKELENLEKEETTIRSFLNKALEMQT